MGDSVLDFEGSFEGEGKRKLKVECGCAGTCCIFAFEYFDEPVPDMYLCVYPKWRHKSHGVIISKEKAIEIVKYLNEFIEGD